MFFISDAYTVIDTVANVDALVIVPFYLQMSALYDVLVQAVNRYLSLFEDFLRENIDFKKNDSRNVKFETFHFNPVECGCFLTLLYLESKSEESLSKIIQECTFSCIFLFKYIVFSEPYRQLLHKQLLLDELTPKFRRANQYFFHNMNKSNCILVNPHLDLKATDNGK